jgi:hypothetical protein
MAENSTSSGQSDTHNSTISFDIGGGDEGVDAGALCVLNGIPTGADIALRAPGQTADHRPLHLTRDALYSREITWAAGRETGFDDVHTQPRQLMGYLQLLRGIEAAAGRLFAITERGIEEDDRDTQVASPDGSVCAGGLLRSNTLLGALSLRAPWGFPFCGHVLYLPVVLLISECW